ncbi:MAG TPA: response regulator transcription factor [Phnomibacter sp.]|nr:response regulator transcription factor [Phnomibacter sp.]
MPLRLLIFEDNESLRESLVTLLTAEADVEIAGAYPNGHDAGHLTLMHEPDAVIMDIDMPRTDGISAVADIKEHRPETAIVMYTQFEDDEKLFASLCAGADGYLLKKSSPVRLLASLREVLEGGAPMSPEIAAKVLRSFRQEKVSFEKKYDLTRREQEMMQLLTKGYSVKLMASEMHIAFETARTHLRNIYRKLHVNCGKEAIAKVLAEKIV